jgi:hypothetical protein
MHVSAHSTQTGGAIPARRIARNLRLFLAVTFMVFGASPAWASHWIQLNAAELEKETRHKMVAVQHQYIAPYSSPAVPGVGSAKSMEDAVAIITGLAHAYAKEQGLQVIQTTTVQRPWQFVTDKSGCGARVRIFGTNDCADSGVVYQTYVTTCVGATTTCDTARAHNVIGSVITRMYYDFIVDTPADNRARITAAPTKVMPSLRTEP